MRTGAPLLGLLFGGFLVAHACAVADDDAPVGDQGHADLPAVLVEPRLQEIVRAGLDRDTRPLLAALESTDAGERAAAAGQLGSVQDPSAAPALGARLYDSEVDVRRHAAFALGQLGPTTSVADALVGRLPAEGAAPVRETLLEATGKAGGDQHLANVLRWADEHARAADQLGLALSLYHFARRGVASPVGRAPLLLLVLDSEPQAASTAALAVAAAEAPSDWGITAADLRATLDSLPADAEAAAPLLGVLVRAETDGLATEDLDRLRVRASPPSPWRVRLAAARALGTALRNGLTDTSAAAAGPIRTTREALLAALDDPSHHVAEGAARTVMAQLGGDEASSALAAFTADTIATRARGLLESGRPLVASVFLPALVGTPHEPFVLAWGGGQLEPAAPAELAFPALARVGATLADRALVDALERGPRRQAYQAAAALATRLDRDPAEPTLEDRVAPVLVERMALWGPHAPMSDLRGLLNLVSTLAERRPDLAWRLMAVAIDHPHPVVRALAEPESSGAVAGALASGPRRRVDWSGLRDSGPRPRLAFRTDHGEFVVELETTAAPLATSALLAWAGAGDLDGRTFHRVEPDFILQSGDLLDEAGFGGPTRGLRSEFSPVVRYVPGVMGMASAGKDTEGSQYFITHGYAPSLDGRYGAVGRVVSGLDVAFRVTLGDTVRSVQRVEPVASFAPEGGGGDAE